MALADRVKDTTLTSGTGTVTLAQSVQTGYQLFGTAFAAASTVTYCISSRTTADWEVGNGVFTPPATLTRSPTSSSNAGALVTFGTEIKDVFVTQSASNIAKQLSSDDITFSASVPFTGQGVRYMPQQSVASVIAFTPTTTGAVKNAQVYVRLLADATNVPTFVGFKEWGGSLGYDNRNQIANQITFWYDGYDYWLSVSQAVGAVATPVSTTGFTLSGPTSGVASTASTSFTVGVTPTGSALTGTIVVTPNDAAGGGTFTPASLSLSGTSATGTFTYTPSATVAIRTISITNNGSLTNPASISYNVTAAATAPGAPTIGTATQTGSTTATVAFTAPASNGGAAITGYTATSSPGGITGTLSQAGSGTITVSGLTAATAYTFTVTATNSVGTSSASAASNSITTAAASFPRMQSFTLMAESGTGPYSYTASAPAQFGSGPADSVSILAFQSGVDGSFVIKPTVTPSASGPEVLLAVDPSATTGKDYTSVAYAVINHLAGYNTFGTAGAPASSNTSIPGAANDYFKVTRTGSSLAFAVSKDTGTTYTTVATWNSVSTGVLYIHGLSAASAVFIPISATGLA